MVTQSIRCFVAIELPDKVQHLLTGVQGSLREEIVGASWTRKGNFHLTLKFIGEVEDEKIAQIDSVLQRTLLSYKPFLIEVGGIGVFPSLDRPRVLWIGLKDGKADVSRLAGAINRGFVKIGIRNESRFHPHLTLARLRRPVNLESKIEFFKKFDKVIGTELTVNQIALIKSELQRSGAVYTSLKHYKLGQGES